MSTLGDLNHTNIIPSIFDYDFMQNIATQMEFIKKLELEEFEENEAEKVSF